MVTKPDAAYFSEAVIAENKESDIRFGERMHLTYLTRETS